MPYIVIRKQRRVSSAIKRLREKGIERNADSLVIRVLVRKNFSQSL